MHKSKGVAPVVIVLLIALGLIGGAAAGYEFREPIKKALQGKSTADEIKDAENAIKNELGSGKFELEGVTTEVNAAGKQITVKIKSSTDSIKDLRLSEAPIAISDTADIIFGSNALPARICMSLSAIFMQLVG